MSEKTDHQLIDGFHAHGRMSRCGSCYWALYDGTWCQNSKCAQHGRAVEWNRIYLTNREAQILIESTRAPRSLTSPAAT